MPYIKRDTYERAGLEPVAPGELNYALTMRVNLYIMGVITLREFTRQVEGLCAEYMARNGVSYTNYNNLLGALYCCGMEVFRRVNISNRAKATICTINMNTLASRIYRQEVAPYEDEKILQNGDVFPEELVRE